MPRIPGLPSVIRARFYVAACVLLLLTAFSARCQYNTNYNLNWAFGDQAFLTFAFGTPIASSSNINILEGCGSVSDTAGHLLFYTDGKKVWDRTGTVMPHGSSIVAFGTGDAAQGATIVPVVGDPNKYYIFSSDQYSSGDVAYSVVDMSLNGGLGDVLAGSGVPLGNHFAEKMTTVAGNNCNVWLILHRRDSAVFWVYNINSTGVAGPVVSAVGTITPYNAGVTKVSPNRLKVVAQLCEGTSHGTELFDFNPGTGVISNCQDIDLTGSNYGAEFSPDNTKLYGSTLYGATVYQYDLSAGSTAAIIASKTTVGTTSNAGDFKLGPDGKIYIVRDGSSVLDRIDNPNAAGTACGYSPGAVLLASGTHGELGLPNLYFAVVPSDTVLRRHDTDACPLPGGILLLARDSMLGSYYMWDDGVTVTRYRTGISTAGTYYVSIYNGCDLQADTFHVTFKPAPGPITGTLAVCAGGSSTLSDTSTSAVWSSGTTSVATIDSFTGHATSVSIGTSTISYTYVSDGCSAFATYSVNPFPSVFGGPPIVCAGSVTLADSIPGGMWTSSNPLVATIDTFSGVVSRISLGTTNITYTLPTGCSRSELLSVNPYPGAITGATAVCVGISTTLGNSAAGGVWSSSSPTVASIGSASGVYTGVSAGTATISYTLPGGCMSTTTVTVNLLPGPITGVQRTCVGSTTFLSDPGGGAWSSSSPGTGSVTSYGLVTGVSTGICVITYSLGVGCNATLPVTISPVPAAITGIFSVCPGTTTTLGNIVPGGYWTSLYPSVASVDSLTGVVTGVATGAAPISYTVGPGSCYAIATVNVLPRPAAISGSSNLCAGSTTALFDAGGGTWSSGTPVVATVDSASGVVTGVAGGTVTITYSVAAGCNVFMPMTVDAAPAAITGTFNLCAGQNDTMINATAGGYWGSTNYSVVGIDAATGVATGVTADTATITYTLLSTGCAVSATVTVHAVPAPVTGPSALCSGSTAILADGTAGGVWSSGTPSVAAINPATGICLGIGSGSTTIRYTTDGVCSVLKTVNVYPAPAAITGTLHICTGASIVLADLTPGGMWSSALPGTASIGSGSGIATGLAAGATAISYSFGGGLCYTTTVLTVNPTPPAITGASRACTGMTALLSDGLPGGTWTSASTAIAAPGTPGGTIAGVATGTTTITYTTSAGCFATTPFTVNPQPALITGLSSVCVGTAASETDLTPGGMWSRSNADVIIGSLTGVVTGVLSGTSVISYTLPTGCYVTKVITINAVAPPITGTLNVCPGTTSMLSDLIGGGTWTSSSPTVATVGSLTGIVTGVATGICNITYLTPSGCSAYATVTVNPSPAAISGPAAVCAASNITMLDPTPGGLWSSSGSSAYAGSVSGIVTGVSAGSAVISYMLPTGCFRTMTITVNPQPVISGPAAVCNGASVLETAVPGGGVWTSGTMSVATVGSASGAVTGVALGTSIITYASAAGCRTMKTMTVSTAPTAILGAPTVCTGAGITLSDAVGGGLWSTTSGTVTIGSLSGSVTGVAAGSAVVTYSLGTGCTVTRTISILSSPVSITGGLNVCTSATTLLTDGTPGGIWSCGTGGIATIGSLTGLVSGVATGIAAISYTIPTTGCATTVMVTVAATPPAIGGPAAVCQGSAVVETEGLAGGIWSSLSPLVSIGSITGSVTGTYSGIAAITYTAGATGTFAGCAVSRTISVNPIPTITGPAGLCVGATAGYTGSPGSGAWVSSIPSVASVGLSTGLATGVAAGSSVITYTSSAGCMATRAVTVNPAVPAITGVTNLCVGTTVVLSDLVAGGRWSSSNPTIAAIGSTGVVSGASAGVATISYVLASGCGATVSVTVNSLPAAIGGASQLCVGTSSVMTDVTPGGIWSGGTTGIATIGSLTGTVTSVASGTVTISYTTSIGCTVTRPVTINMPPAAITGSGSVCIGQTRLLVDTTPGGTWSTSGSIATIGSTGTVTGIVAGISTITYALSTGCMATTTVTVAALPLPITGTASVCVGSMTTLSDATLGGSWTSGATGTASVISFSGVVTGVAAGVAAITYTAPGGCSVTRFVTVNELPLPITGSPAACVGAGTALGESTPGGTWSSSNTAIATVGPTGIVTGVGAGIAIITYSSGAGCITTLWMTVNPAPPAITGTLNICSGAATTLSDAAPGGTWSSSTTTVATIGVTTGVATGAGGGSTTISYTATTGCVRTATLNVIAVPAISGLRSMCAWGDTLHIADAMTTGIYTSSGVTVTSPGGGLGILQSAGPGVWSVYYTVPLGCYSTATITVNPLPNVITGIYSVCMGTTATLHDASTGGRWTSSAPGIAMVDSGTGVVSGVSAGAAYITYTLPTGCKTDTPVHVRLGPSFVSGYPTMVVGTSGTYYDLTTGGVWSSSNTMIATIGLTTGIAHAVSAGVVTFTYTLTTGCRATKMVTVDTLGPTNPLTTGRYQVPGLELTVRPNPNDGDFIISATIGDDAEVDEDAWIEITDLAGRMVYRTKVAARDGVIDEEIKVRQQLASGVYLLGLKYGSAHKAVRMIVMGR